jgi:hypothetical protein
MPTAAVDVSEILSQFDDEAEAIEPGGAQELPIGNYQVEVQAPGGDVAKMVTVDSDGATRARVVVECVEASESNLVGVKDSESWTIVNPDGSLNENGVRYLKGFIQLCGFEMNDFSLGDLPEIMPETIGNLLEISVYESESNGTVYKNIRFKNRVSGGSSESADY